MAGEVSKDLTRRILLPEEIVEAHEQGIIHFHDSDYFAQKEHNCDLINLEDMLQNGTCISETKIDKPHSFYTACNVTTQIVAQVASNQYGGQSFSLGHLAPFVQVSREKITKEVLAEREQIGLNYSDEQVKKIVERRLKDEINRGIQTIQYQLITLMTCNGQAPFVTMFMYLDEVPEGQTRDDLATLIEEVLKQPSDNFVSVILTDKVDVNVFDMQDRLRHAFPNLLEIRRETLHKANYEMEKFRHEAELDAFSLCSEFIGEMNEEEREILKQVINKVEEESEL